MKHIHAFIITEQRKDSFLKIPLKFYRRKSIKFLSFPLLLIVCCVMTSSRCCSVTGLTFSKLICLLGRKIFKWQFPKSQSAQCGQNWYPFRIIMFCSLHCKLLKIVLVFFVFLRLSKLFYKTNHKGLPRIRLVFLFSKENHG